GEALLRQHTHRRLETHRPPQVRIPVRTIHDRGVRPLPRHRREQRHPPADRCETAERAHQRRLDPLHLRRVRRIVHLDAPRPHTTGRTQRQKLIKAVHGPKAHHRRRPLHRRHPHPLPPPRHHSLPPPPGTPHRPHPP